MYDIMSLYAFLLISVSDAMIAADGGVCMGIWDALCCAAMFSNKQLKSD